MTDRLTPPMLLDLAEIDERIFGETPWSRALRREAARREADATPTNGRGHIPLITCPGSKKSCVGYDCLDKGCLDGEPMASGGVSVPELRNSNISLGGCEVCTTPTACKQEKHCDHYRLPWSDREGPGSAAIKDKPAPADDLLMSNVDAFLCLPTAEKSVFEADNLLSRSRDRIEALTARVRQLERKNSDQRAIIDAQKARADGLAANNATLIEALTICRELADRIAKAPFSVRNLIDDALTEGGA